MNPISRRSFIGPAATGLIALGAAGSEAEAQLVYQSTDWRIKEFEQLARSPARVKQVFDVTAIADPTLLNPIKNAMKRPAFRIRRSPGTNPDRRGSAWSGEHPELRRLCLVEIPRRGMAERDRSGESQAGHPQSALSE
jgi:hypothetical protein